MATRVYEFAFPVLRTPIASVRIDDLMAAAAEGMVDAQHALNEQTRESLSCWEEAGIPPSSFILSRCRMWFPTQVRLEAERNEDGQRRVELRPRFRSRARVTLSYRYLPKPFDE
jgi:hypothetical protein